MLFTDRWLPELLSFSHSAITRLRPSKSHKANIDVPRRARATRGAFNFRVSKPTNRYEGQARDAQGNHLNGVNFGARSRWFSFLADSTA
ncbi:hypothetical protein [Bradyrhizobium sp. AZCC 2289]|uniref:hypothetical protein n=1 Tax=Bradyrhizobium sp. AZCC 2289 TaxID=3117026 RepID=UPI002FF26BB1